MATVGDERLAGPDERARRLWGTDLPERQWGTVREDTSADGQAWTSFPCDFGFGDADPPVHALAVRRVFEADREAAGRPDLDLLERAFRRLLLNFTWWVDRNDASGRGLFGGGFMGLDDIGLFDRDQAPSFGAGPLQADATAWGCGSTAPSR